MECGKQIRVMRQVRDMMQRELGKKVGERDGSLLSYIERGQMLPSADLLERVKRALGWPAQPLDELAFAILEGTVATEADLVDWLDGKAIVRIPFVDPPG